MAKRGKSRAAKRRARRALLPPGVYDLKVADVKDFGMGFDVTYDMIGDDRYNIMRHLQCELAKASREAQDREASAIFADAIYKGRDGYALADWKTTRDIYERCQPTCPANCTATRDEHKTWAHAENYGDAKFTVRQRFSTRLGDWKAPNYAPGSFSSLLAPGLKQVFIDSLTKMDQAKEEISMAKKIKRKSNIVAGGIICTAAPKPLVARTKREKALVEQTRERVSREAGQEGYEAGLRAGQLREREHSEAFLLKIVAAFRGPRSSSASFDE